MKKIFIIIILLLTATCRFQLKAAKRALIIGISCYEQHKLNQLDWHPIHGTNDVAMIGATLKKQGFSVARLTNNKATAQNIKKAFIALTRQSQTGDIIYIHFSGHGQPVEDCNGDEPDGWDEAIVPYDAGQKYVKNVYDGRNHIIDDELNDLVTGIRRKVGKSGFVYVVIDACHSGGLRKPTVTKKDSLGEDRIKKSQIMLFLSSRGNESSYETPIYDNGYFTKYLAEAFRGAADADKNGRITAWEMYAYVYKKVVEAVQGRQHPVMWGYFNKRLILMDNNAHATH